MTDPIKAKIIELVPEVAFFKNGCPRSHERPITLADVLRAIQKKSRTEVCVGMDGSFCIGDSPKRAFWNLTTDYDGQTQEVKDFIGKLLNV